MLVLLAYAVSTIFGTNEAWETLAQTTIAAYFGYLSADKSK